jgi:hypothetical protein
MADSTHAFGINAIPVARGLAALFGDGPGGAPSVPMAPVTGSRFGLIVKIIFSKLHCQEKALVRGHRKRRVVAVRASPSASTSSLGNANFSELG